jgi:hypothetical protein
MRLTSPRSSTPCAMALTAVLGCGPTVSLDELTADGGSSSTSTGAGPFGPLTTDEGGPTLGSLDDDIRLDVPGTKLDVAPDVPLPPGSCPPDCQLELDLAWSYDGFADGTPLDPQDHVAVLVEPIGTIVVAQQRHGELELARLSQTGQELWTLPLSLPCDPCRLVDLDLLPSGDLLLAGHGVDATGTPAALAARVDLGGPQLQWATSTPLTGGSAITPRAGSLVVHDDLLFQPVLEATPDGDGEQLELFAYDLWGGGLLHADAVAIGFPTGDALPPLAAYDTAGTLVVTHPAWSGLARLMGAVRWLSTPSSVELAYDARAEPSLRLVASPDGRVLTLGQTAGDRQSLIYLESGDRFDTSQWQIIHVLPTITSSGPALAVDDFGHAHVLARTAQGLPELEDAVTLEVMRWSDEGALVWKLSLPLALDRVDEPVSLALDPAGALVIGGLVGGARHVEQRVPVCSCG